MLAMQGAQVRFLVRELRSHMNAVWQKKKEREREIEKGTAKERQRGSYIPRCSV